MSEIKELSSNVYSARINIIEEMMRLSIYDNCNYDAIYKISHRLARQEAYSKVDLQDREQIIKDYSEAFWSFFPDETIKEKYKREQEIEYYKAKQIFEPT